MAEHCTVDAVGEKPVLVASLCPGCKTRCMLVIYERVMECRTAVFKPLAMLAKYQSLFAIKPEIRKEGLANCSKPSASMSTLYNKTGVDSKQAENEDKENIFSPFTNLVHGPLKISFEAAI